MQINLKKAIIDNDKYTYKTKYVYSWIGEDKECYETEVIEKQKTPHFDYSHEHMI